MKYIFAIIQPQKVADVRVALADLGVDAFIVVEVQRYGQYESHTEYFRGAEFEVGFMPRTKIELVVADDAWEKTVKVITDAASTGKIGDGRIFVANLEHTVEIRSGKSGDDAKDL